MTGKPQLSVQQREHILATADELLDNGGPAVFFFGIAVRGEEIVNFKVCRGKLPVPIFFGMATALSTFMMLSQAREEKNRVICEMYHNIPDTQDTCLLTNAYTFPADLSALYQGKPSQNDKDSIHKVLNHQFEWGCDSLALYGITFDGKNVFELRGSFGSLQPCVKIALIATAFQHFFEGVIYFSDIDSFSDLQQEIIVPDVTFH
jgi:hypothetical protein